MPCHQSQYRDWSLCSLKTIFVSTFFRRGHFAAGAGGGLKFESIGHDGLPGNRRTQGSNGYRVAFVVYLALHLPANSCNLPSVFGLFSFGRDEEGGFRKAVSIPILWTRIAFEIPARNQDEQPSPNISQLPLLPQPPPLGLSDWSRLHRVVSLVSRCFQSASCAKKCRS